ncbi:chlorophyll synthesis pathway protein BchC [Roseateles toxinivorans]|uniref:3-hydroxyethyl bacteriochlorophyllide a dehydrogenase n=1 Tax=Roseateles toxinivorans TaxID=270368 RepID=A0A4R6QQ13_9BURK|nr:chlorophyll synthesis pathway protein BchC [Roseateles toxinivorans]TDP71748.1 3-hydroxyethyl bacteriochlorophyllide a dehydrogenase [Roseateles toxinivorans]
MNTLAVVIDRPEHLQLSHLHLPAVEPEDVIVEVEWSGISTGTERLIWTGTMPMFPGMGYPLVPGYEAVGRVISAGAGSSRRLGQRVFVPGARCFGEVKGLFGGSASRLVVPGAKVVPVDEKLGAQAVLLALAATAYHSVAGGGQAQPFTPPDLIVGHGVLGRLLARMNVAAGITDFTVWETNPKRAEGGVGYTVVHPDDDKRRDYKAIYDVSGDSALLDSLIARLAPGGEVVLAGFYAKPLSLNFAPAFMREARIRVAAEWKRPDMLAVNALLADGRLSLDGLLTHSEPAEKAGLAYQQAFTDAGCLKMVLDWRHHA